MDRPDIEFIQEAASHHHVLGKHLNELSGYIAHLEGIIREALEGLPRSQDGELDVYSRFRVNNVRETLELSDISGQLKSEDLKRQKSSLEVLTQWVEAYSESQRKCEGETMEQATSMALSATIEEIIQANR